MPSATNGFAKATPRHSPKPEPKLYSVRETPFQGKQKSYEQSYDSTSSETAIVIDNGSGTTKAGWSSDRSPRMILPPVMSRYTDRKLGQKFTFVGTEASVDANSRQQIKSAFGSGSGIVTNWDVMEGVLDYIFLKLGVDGEDGGIGRPVVMTEAVANLAFSRKAMTETLFECYSAPSVAFGIDSLFSFSHNGGSTGLVVSSSHTSTHVIPVIESRPLLTQATRLNWGASQSSEYLLKLLQLKYPTFPGKLTINQAADMVREHCYISQDYDNELRHYLDWTGLEDRDHIVQYPFTEQAAPPEKTEEELARIAERKKESGRRLQEQAAKQRLEKLMRKEQDLEYYRDLQQKAQTVTKKEFRRLLESNELRHEADLERTIKDLDQKIRKARMKDLGGAADPNPEEQDVAPSYPLLDIPDAELDEAALRQKRHQRLLKSGYESRQRAKAEKASALALKEEEIRLDELHRTNDLESWLRTRRTAYENLRQRLKDRERLKQDLGNRKSLASQIRMKSIANLASDNNSGKKRRRGGNNPSGNPDRDDNDTFGANDDDWGVYRTIATDAAGSDDEDEDADVDAQLLTLEAELLQHDPSFTEHDTLAAASDWTQSLLHAFLRGPRPFDPESASQAHQLHLNVERIRVPEALFQPSIAGVDQAGLVEIAADILTQRISDDVRDAVARDVFCTGGYALFDGFEQRLARELRAVLPVDREVRVRRARDPVKDAWKGAAAWAGGEAWRKASVSRDEYLEKGAEYIKEHDLGNAFSG